MGLTVRSGCSLVAVGSQVFSFPSALCCSVAKEDIIGISIYIPGGRIGTSYASSVSIKMKNDIFDGGADLEGTDED